MKRWVWLGLVGGLLACNEEKPPVDPPVEPLGCLDTSASSQPGSPLSSREQELSPEAMAAAKEGRQPVIIRYRRTLSSSAIAVPRAIEDAVVGTGGAEKAQVHAMVTRLLPGIRIVGADAGAGLPSMSRWERAASCPQTAQIARSLTTSSATLSRVGIGPNGHPRKSMSSPAATT